MARTKVKSNGHCADATRFVKHPRVFEDEVRGNWFVLHSRTNQERRLASSLHDMDVPFYLPLSRRVVYAGAKRRVEWKPLFPNYLFVRCDLDQVYQADRTKKVSHVLPVNDQVQLETELRDLHMALSHEDQLDPHPLLREGMRVEVHSGPLKGLRGMIAQKTCRTKLVLHVGVLGQATSLEIDGSLLTPID